MYELCYIESNFHDTEQSGSYTFRWILKVRSFMHWELKFDLLQPPFFLNKL